MNTLKLVIAGFLCVGSTLAQPTPPTPPSSSSTVISGALSCVSASASGTAYTCTTSPVVTPVSNTLLSFKADVANTGSATLRVNGGAIATIKKQGGGTNLVAGELLAGQWTNVIFDGTNWQMQGQTGLNAIVPTTFIFGVPVTGASLPVANKYAAASGDVDIIQAPTGKRMLIQAIGGYNVTAGTVNWYPELKSGGVYYRLAATAAVLTHANSVISAVSIILEPGESFAVNTDAAGFNFSASVVQFDSTSPIRSVKSLGLSTGNQTVYTAPVGKTSTILPVAGPSFNGSSLIGIVNDGGGTHNFQICAVASGGSTACAANSVNQIAAQTIGANTRANAATVSENFAAGDFLVVNVDTGNAAQILWVNVLEF